MPARTFLLILAFISPWWPHRPAVSGAEEPAAIAKPQKQPTSVKFFVRGPGSTALNIPDRTKIVTPQYPQKNVWSAECCIQMASLYHGNYFPQELIHSLPGRAAPPDGMHSKHLPPVLEALSLSHSLHEGNNVVNYQSWIKAQLDLGVPTIVGVKFYPDRHPEWFLDRFFLAVGCSPAALICNTGCRRQKLNGQETLSWQSLRTPGNSCSFVNRSNFYWGCAVTGNREMKVQTRPVRLLVLGETPAALQLLIQIESLQPGKSYNLLRFGHVAYLASGDPEKAVWRDSFQASAAIHVVKQTVPATQIAAYRCVVAAQDDYRNGVVVEDSGDDDLARGNTQESPDREEGDLESRQGREDSEIRVASSSEAASRQWTDVSGQYHVEAELAGVISGNVRLKTNDGRMIEVPIEKLSEADRRYINSLRNPGTRQSTESQSRSQMPVAQPLTKKRADIRYGQAAIENALVQQGDYEFNTTLEDVIDHLEDRHKVKFFIDRRALNDVGLTADAVVIAKGSHTLESVLDELLRAVNLAWTIRDEVLMITTPDQLEADLDTRVYKFVQPVLNLDTLLNGIRTKVAPNEWDVVGGSGSIEVWPGGAVVVAQSYPVHRQLQREYAQVMQSVDGKKPKVKTRRPARVNLKTINTLSQPSGCEFVDTPLHEVVAELSKRHAIEIVLDERALNDVGMSSDVPVTCNLGGIGLESALNLMLGQFDLAWSVDNGTLTITTAEGDEARLIEETYDVRDLVTMVRGDVDSLLDIITGTVAPATWNQVGGPGSIKVNQLGLVIGQTFHNHRRIQRLLEDLRQVHSR